MLAHSLQSTRDIARKYRNSNNSETAHFSLSTESRRERERDFFAARPRGPRAHGARGIFGQRPRCSRDLVDLHHPLLRLCYSSSSSRPQAHNSYWVRDGARARPLSLSLRRCGGRSSCVRVCFVVSCRVGGRGCVCAGAAYVGRERESIADSATVPPPPVPPLLRTSSYPRRTPRHHRHHTHRSIPLAARRVRPPGARSGCARARARVCRLCRRHSAMPLVALALRSASCSSSGSHNGACCNIRLLPASTARELLRHLTTTTTTTLSLLVSLLLVVQWRRRCWRLDVTTTPLFGRRPLSRPLAPPTLAARRCKRGDSCCLWSWD